jgi:predicted nucleotidyltransferase
MLDLVTKSEVRKKIILLLLYNPDNSYYLRQISYIVNASPGNVRQELIKLEINGLLIKERRANLVYFKINTKNPLFNDFKNIVDKTIGIRKVLEEELKKTKGIKFAFLFGSYVKGDFTPDSDIDLYVIGNIKEKELYEAIKKAEKIIYRQINYHLAAPGEFREEIKKSFFHKDIVKNHILIIGDQDEFKKFIR